MIRISGGLARGITLKVTKSKLLRPATEANRERLFSSISESLSEALVLDLFAGSGSYGLEALSRGAKFVHFVENNGRIFSDLKRNFEKVRKSARLIEKAASFSNRDVIEFLRKRENTYDIIFLDPPYKEFPKIGNSVFDFLITHNFVHQDTILVHEAPMEEVSSFENWELLKVLGKEKAGTPNYRFYTPEFSASGQ